MSATDLTHLDFVEHVFLPEAIRRHLVAFPQDAALQGLVRQLRADATAPTMPAQAPRPTAAALPPPTGHPWAAPPWGVAMAVAATPSAPPSFVPRETLVSRPTPPVAPVPRPPSPLQQWWSRTVRAIGSDLAVHGLAYLGVLLFFVGAFGLVAFAFADVATGLRPLAEVVIAAAPFAAGALLRRRRAVAVGRSLELAGGLVLPIMLVTSFLDEVAFPPDLEGAPLVVVLPTVMVGLAGAYAFWSRRHVDSSLRFLVGPVCWLAAGLAAMGLGGAIPVGKAVATPSAAQVAAMAVALTVTLGWARLRPQARLSRPTETAALPALVVLAVLAVLTWAADGWPVLAVLVSGVALVAALELVSPRVPALLVGVAGPAWWALVWVALEGSARSPLERSAVATMAAAGFLALLEVSGQRRRPAPALVLPLVGAGLAFVSLLGGNLTWAAAGLAGGSAWAVVRRRAPYAAPGSAALLDAAAAVLPLAAVGALLQSGRASGGAAVLAEGLVLLALAVPAARGWLDRSAGETYWRAWWCVGLVLVLAHSLSAWAGAQDTAEVWQAVAGLALLSIGSVVGPLRRPWRPVAATVAATMGWLMTSDAAGLTHDVRWSVLALVALGLVVLVHLQRAPVADEVRDAAQAPVVAPLPAAGAKSARAALGVAAHVLALLVVPSSAETGWGLVVAVGAATSGLLVTGWRDVRGWSPVGNALRGVHPSLANLPLALGALGVPAACSLALDRSGLLLISSSWSVAVPSAIALSYAAASGLALPARVGPVLARIGVLLATVSPMLAVGRVPAALAMVVLMAAVAAVPVEHRIAPMTWAGWVAAAPAVHLLGAEYLPLAQRLLPLEWSAVVLVAVGAVLTLAGLAVGRRSQLVGQSWPTVAAIVGALELATGFATGVVGHTGTVAGWLCAAVAVVALVAGLVTQVGAMAGLALLLGWWATLLLAGPVIEGQPWVALVVAACLLLVAHALSRIPTASRWVLPVLAAAAPVAVTGLVLAVGTGFESVCWATAGVQCLAVAARVRRQTSVAAALAVLGTALVLLGAAVAGTGWLALACLGLAVLLTVAAGTLSRSAEADERPRHQVLSDACRIGAALFAVAAGSLWLDWLGWSPQRSLDTAALLSATVLVLATVLLRVLPGFDRSWWLPWGGLAALVELGLALTALMPQAHAGSATVSWALAFGTAVGVVSVAVSADPVRLGLLREAAAGQLLLTVLIALRAGDVPDPMRVGALSAVAAAAAVALLATSNGPLVRWQRPLVVLSGAAIVLGLANAWDTDAPALAVPLAVASVQTAAAGVALGRVGLQMLSPALACAAWVSFVFASLDERPEWATAPAGLAALVAVGLWRRDRTMRSQPMAAPEVVVLELAGIALLVGPSLASTVTVGPAHALVALVLGIAITGWGVVTEVRRRAAAGATTVLTALLLLVAVPLVDLLPRWQGAALWALIATVGLVAVLAAAFLERGRVVARKGLAHLAEATSGWE